MSSILRVSLSALVVVLAAVSLAVAPAFAKGGGGTTPTPPTFVSYCPQGSWLIDEPDGSTLFANEAGGAGCVWVHSYPAGYLRLDSVILAPGWTYEVLKDGEGTSSRVELEFTETATGNTIDFRVEFGKTRVG